MANPKRTSKKHSCPECQQSKRQLVREFVPGVFHIPDRLILQCDKCRNVWYIPENADKD